MLQAVADVRNVHEALLVEVVPDDKLPGRARGVQALALVAGDHAVAGRLVGVQRQHVAVEVGRVVLHGARGRDEPRAAAAVPVAVAGRGAPVPAARRAQDLVLRAHLLQVPLQLLVLGGRLLLRRLEGGEFCFEVFDMAFFSFPEGALAVG